VKAAASRARGPGILRARSRALANRSARTVFATLAAACLALVLSGCRQADVALQVGAGFTARVLCSLVFNSGMDPDRAFDDYVAPKLGPAYRLASFEIDYDARSVVGYGLNHEALAIHRDGVGCTLVADANEAELRAAILPARAEGETAPGPDEGAWPRGNAGPARLANALAAEEIEAAILEAFDEPNPGGPLRLTTAVAVAHRGQLIAERYAPGFVAETPLISWSMAKSVVATLIAIASHEGRFEIDGPAPVPEWQEPGDPRGEITVDELLRMSSGLEFDEYYGAINDVSVMLFTRRDAGAFGAGKPLAHPRDEVWAYSSGTSNILARVLRMELGDDLAALVRWSRSALFDRIGMRTAFFEPDASGSFIGSSFVFASARDWTRFGQLHLQDGIWEGERILPEGWVDYVRTPTPAADRGRYGAHWWLNAGTPARPEDRDWPSLPREVYAARGMSGQYVVVVPSAELVVVRLGLAQAEGDALHGIERLVKRILDAVDSATPDVASEAAPD